MQRLPSSLLTVVSFLALLFLTAAAAPAADLPRRGLLGVSTGEKDGYVVVLSVLPSLPGAAAGLQKDDVIVTIDGVSVANTAQFLERLRRPGGRAVAIGMLRNGAPQTVRATLVEASRETDPLVDTRYESVQVDRSLRRTLVTVPHGVTGRRPAVLIVGGIGCFSVDIASNTEDAYRRLTHDLSRGGFATMRLEKSGAGDSQGPPCPTIDYDAEAASYARALDALRREPNVDPARIYVLGHSIGTIIGPRLALAESLAGVIAVDGVARNWVEYELSNSRRQEELAGETPSAVDAALAMKEECMHRLLIEREPRATLLAARPECKDYIAYPAPDAYFQEVARLNLAEPWMKLTQPVLAVYGTGDFITDEADHRRVVQIVNGAHPGAGTLVVIPGMDHYLTPAGSQRASFDRLKSGGSAPYDRRLSDAVLGWLCARERCPPASG